MTDAPAPPGRHDPPLPALALAEAGGPVAVAEQPKVTVYPVTFSGQAGEYFRIWIVNTALSVVTLGLYLPWARVRQRQYLYGHTWLDGQNFEYTANPVALLRGYLIVGAFFLAYLITGNLERLSWVAGSIAALFFVLYPWLVMKSLRFLAVSTMYRGLRFRHHGRAGGAYLTYGLANLAAVLTGGLALPWAWFMQRRYQVQNAAYGNARMTFRGDAGGFYVIALTGVALAVGGAVLLAVPLIALMALLGDQADLDLASTLPPAVLLGMGAAYLGFLLLYAVAWQYVRAATLRYVLNHVEVGGVVRTGATFSSARLTWIGVSNAAAQVLTLGLAVPWATIRRARYIAAGVQVRAIASLDDFAASQTPQEGALGEAATELLDINLGF
ncbi:hypothetical protein Dcar01_00793 [Deinococcus carri]|uniref:DUF898 domain-containing protein n=1 Tax=Deinococcus carri TaxID=1211323 RepID=A0ABP9W3Z1_9DEIO